MISINFYFEFVLKIDKKHDFVIIYKRIEFKASCFYLDVDLNFKSISRMVFHRSLHI